jgi:exopolysaccharide biosynthesis polyprenyl glycosylphosphotransferase
MNKKRNSGQAQYTTLGDTMMAVKNNASLVFGLFLIIGDALALIAAFTAAYILRVRLDPRPLLEPVPAMDFLYAFLTVLPFWLLAHAAIGLYNQEVYERRLSELGRLLIGSWLGILLVIGYDFVVQGGLIPARLVPVYGLFLGFGFLLAFRTGARALRRLLFRFGVGVSHVLIVGDTKASRHLAQAIGDTRHSGLRVLGIVGRKVDGFACFSSFAEAIKALARLPNGIIQTELYKDQARNDRIAAFAQTNHISYRFVPGNNDIFVGNIAVELFAGRPMIAVHQTALIGWGRVAKRLFDIAASSAALVLLAPLFLMLAALIKLSDPAGPVLFRQVRLTRFNSQFVCYKFRTMKQKYCVSPEEGFARMGRPDLLKKYRNNGDYLPDDPRLTRLGRFMRRASLDELPQFFNVLRGDLSLVGPRALVPEELDAYAKKHAILSVKAGLTGLAQISGRRDIDFAERRRLDMYYVQNWNFWLDVSIILRTIGVVITGAGAK